MTQDEFDAESELAWEAYDKVKEHFVSQSCADEVCGMCAREGMNTPATHKVGEEIPSDISFGSLLGLHNLTQYLCCKHFIAVFGNAAELWRGCQNFDRLPT